MRSKHYAIIAIALGICGLVALGTANADVGSAVGSGSAVAPALPDPIDSPIESVSLVVKLWKTGTIPAALIVAVFLGLTAASRKIAFLQKGYAAIIAASVLGGLAMLIERASQGTTPTASMVISALLAAVALALKPKTEEKPAA